MVAFYNLNLVVWPSDIYILLSGDNCFFSHDWSNLALYVSATCWWADVDPSIRDNLLSLYHCFWCLLIGCSPVSTVFHNETLIHDI
jgi:hypothetical protein